MKVKLSACASRDCQGKLTSASPGILLAVEVKKGGTVHKYGRMGAAGRDSWSREDREVSQVG